MKLLMIYLLPLAGALAQAQNYTPILDSVNTIDRLRLKENLAGSLTFVPALLSQTLTCNDKNKICTFQVFNKMNAEEEVAIARIRSNGQNTVSMRADLFKDWLTLGEENLEGEMAQIQSSFLTMKNLALLENAYGTSVFRAPFGNTADLLNRYETTGLGEFKITYQLRGVERDFGIRVKMQELEDLVQSKLENNSFSFEDLKALLVSRSFLFSSRGYVTGDVAVITAYQLKDSILRSVAGGKLKLDLKKWAQFKQQRKTPFWTVTESFVNAKERCSVSLPIRKDSKMTQTCEVEYDEE